MNMKKVNVTISHPDTGIVYYEILVLDDDNQHQDNDSLAHNLVATINNFYDTETVD